MKKLNIGCGSDYKKGWINLDSHNRYSAEVVWNLNKLPLPFKDNEFDYVYCSHVLEDFNDPIPLMDEIYRITKRNGLIEYKVPYFTHTWNSIYHKRGFSISSFKTYAKKFNYDVEKNLKIVQLRFMPYRSKSLIGRIYERLVYLPTILIPAEVIEFTFLKYIIDRVQV